MLQRALQNAKSVAISGHVRPDGDCVGSSMGLYNYIRTWYPEVEVDVYLGDIPESFRFIDATKEICGEAKDKIYDLFVALDCGDLSRLDFAAPLFQSAKKTICVDHHISNQSFADENYIKPDASSTSELVFELLDPKRITKEVAECLYLGIVHDTGVFQYSCTSPETMMAAAVLMRTGIDYPAIIHDTFYAKSYAQNKILGKALVDSELFLNGKCIFTALSHETMEQYQVVPKDLEGIVSQLRVTEGTEAAVFLFETAPGEYKVSLRSKDAVDVSMIASGFGGGGHKKAAGVTMKGTVEEVRDAILGKIASQLSAE